MTLALGAKILRRVAIALAEKKIGTAEGDIVTTSTISSRSDLVKFTIAMGLVGQFRTGIHLRWAEALVRTLATDQPRQR